MPSSRGDGAALMLGASVPALGRLVTTALIGLCLTASALAQTTPPATTPAPAGPPLRLGAPQRLVPPPSADAPSAPQGTASSGLPAGASDPAIVANPLAPIDPEWAGPLSTQQGALPANMWFGTPRALVAALVPRLQVTDSPALQGLTRRLLLSNAAPPAKREGDDANLIELRVERLFAAGQLADAASILDRAPRSDASDGLERRRVELLLLAGNRQAACEHVGDGVRRSKDIWWTRALIACQAMSGDSGKANFGLELLRDQKAPKDEAFDTLIGIVSTGKGKLEKLPDPSPLHLALLAAAKQPLPGNSLAAASPAVLHLWASAEGAPIAQRIAAGDRAAALGAFALDDLRALYSKLTVPADDRANAVTKAGEKEGRGHALLYLAAAGKAEGGAARAEILQAMLAEGAKAGDLVFVARLIEPLLLELKPSSDLGWFAGSAARALFVTGHTDQGRAWLAVADPDDAQALYPLTRLALGRAALPFDAKFLTASLALIEKANDDAGARKAALALALLAAFDDPIGPADWAPLAGKLPPLTSLDLPGAPVWFDLPRAAAGKRIGETVLLALVTAGEAGKLTAQPARLLRAIEGLRAIGLDGDARSLAVEAAVDGGL